MSMAYRLNTIKVTTKRELRSTLYGLGIYVVMTLIFMGAAYLSIRQSLVSVVENGLMVLPNPITQPFFLTAGLAATYLGLCAAIAISRERDQGTLEVLFYGPVDTVSYVLGKYLQQILAFLVMLVFAVINFVAISLVTNLGFSGNFLGILILSVFLASCMISFGIFLSAITRRMVVSIVLFLGLVLFFIAFWVAHLWVMSIPGKDLTTLTIFARVVLDNLNTVIQWISPLAYLARGSAAIGMGNVGQYLLSIVSSVIYTALLLGLSIYAFERKGVRR